MVYKVYLHKDFFFFKKFGIISYPYFGLPWMRSFPADIMLG